MRIGTCRALEALLALALVTAPTSAQVRTGPSVAFSTDTARLGEPFELRVSITVPPGSIVFLPDTLRSARDLESAAPVRVHAEAVDGAAALSLVYPLMAFRAGEMTVPGLDMLIEDRRGREGTEDLPGGSVAVRWSEAPAPAGSPGLTRVPAQTVHVAPVITARDLMAGVEPMPASDVAGGNWHWPSLALALLSSTLLAVTVVSTTHGILVRSRREGEGPPTPTLEARRRQTLLLLDQLLAEGLHVRGDALEFYARSSDVVRRYVEALEDDWSSSLTSSELVVHLRSRYQDGAVHALSTRMSTAEAVKFGRLRPSRASAERYWRDLREWIAAFPKQK